MTENQGQWTVLTKKSVIVTDKLFAFFFACRPLDRKCLHSALESFMNGDADCYLTRSGTVATIDITSDLDNWLASEHVQKKFTELISNAVDERLDALLREDLVDTDEAAKILSLTPAAVRKRVERGHLTPVRIGTSLRFRRADLLQR